MIWPSNYLADAPRAILSKLIIRISIRNVSGDFKVKAYAS